MSDDHCGKCGRSGDDLAALHACNQIDCPVRARRKASLRELAIYLGAGVGVSALIVGGCYMLLAGHMARTQVAAAPPPAVRVATENAPPAERTVAAQPAPERVTVIPSADRARELREREARRRSFANLDPALVRPSFDCASARTASQRLICGDPELSIIDRNASILFTEALGRSTDPRMLQRRRAQWIKGRANLPDDRNAVLDYYERWSAELSTLPSRS